MARDTGVLEREKERFAAHIDEFRKAVFVGCDLDRVREFVHEDVIDHFAPETDPPGVEGFIQRFTASELPLTGLEIEVLASAYDGDVFFQIINMRLQHIGAFLGVAATGKVFSIGGFDAFRFRDGKIAEHWGIYDVSKIPDLIADGQGGWSSMFPKAG